MFARCALLCPCQSMLARIAPAGSGRGNTEPWRRRTATKPVKILATFCVRPETLEMYPVTWESRVPREFRVIASATAQHRESSDQVPRLLKLRPDDDQRCRDRFAGDAT